MEQLISFMTVGVITVLGSTFTGHYEPVEKICQVLDELQAATSFDIGVHVDAASGGLVAPFAKVDAGVWYVKIQVINIKILTLVL